MSQAVPILFVSAVILCIACLLGTLRWIPGGLALVLGCLAMLGIFYAVIAELVIGLLAMSR